MTTSRLATIGLTVLLLSAAAPAHADFFDDVRRTFQTDIPHFFQDDIPCAFGGQPTSGAKASCQGGQRPAAQTSGRKVAPPPRAPTATSATPARTEPEIRTPREYP